MRTPDYCTVVGKGVFSRIEETFEAEFVLLRNPLWIGVHARGVDPHFALQSFIAKDGLWKLQGTLEDGRAIVSESLCHIRSSPSDHSQLFTALQGVELGTRGEGAPQQSQFPLLSYFDGSVALSFNDWEIVIDTCDDIADRRELALRWRMPIEGMVLTCSTQGADETFHLKTARSLLALATLAQGTGISTQRHLLRWDSNEVEVWRFMTGKEFGPGPIVPASSITDFLRVALPKYHALTERQRAAFDLSLKYINLSANGYLDTRLLAISQGWELLASEWAAEQPLDSTLQELRTTLKKDLRAWRLQHQGADPDGFLTARILNAFEWPRLKSRIERFALSQNVDLHALGLDLDRLKSTRDAVAHSGRLVPEADPGNQGSFGLLTQAQRALQMTLLRLLAYNGLVHSETDGWQTTLSIDDRTKGKTKA